MAKQENDVSKLGPVTCQGLRGSDKRKRADLQEGDGMVGQN